MRESCGRTALNPLLRQNSRLKYVGMSAFEFFVKDEFSIRRTIGKRRRQRQTSAQLPHILNDYNRDKAEGKVD